MDKKGLNELNSHDQAIVLKHLLEMKDERIQELEAVAEALLECERDRVAQMERYSSIIEEQSPQLAPDRQLYMKAVELARKAIHSPERG